MDWTVTKLRERLPRMSDLELGRTRKVLTHRDRDGLMREDCMELCARVAQEYKRRGYNSGTLLLPKSEHRATCETVNDE
jgi:hypothetical protein